MGFVIELQIVQAPVHPTLFVQGRVRALFVDATGVHDDDGVRLQDRRKPVRDGDDRLALGECFQRDLDHALALAVECARGFV